MTGSRGPISQPNNVRHLRGNPGKRVTKPSVKARPGVPSPPAGMTPAALTEWRRIVPLLVAEGNLARLDRAVLVVYCEAYAAMNVARTTLDEEGEVIRGAMGGLVKHPAWMIWREASATVLAASKELLATPIARLRTMKPEADDGKDPAQGILD